MGLDRADTDLKIGDIILSVNDKKIDSNFELNNLVKESNGNSLKLKITRNNEELETFITPLKSSSFPIGY